MEEKLTDKQITERDELIASLNKEDLFEKRKYTSPRDAFSGFILGAFIVALFSTIAFWSGALTNIDIRLISFCLLPGGLIAFIEYRYNIGSTTYGAIFLLIIFVSWIVHYGYKYLHI